METDKQLEKFKITTNENSVFLDGTLYVKGIKNPSRYAEWLVENLADSEPLRICPVVFFGRNKAWMSRRTAEIELLKIISKYPKFEFEIKLDGYTRNYFIQGELQGQNNSQNTETFL